VAFLALPPVSASPTAAPLHRNKVFRPGARPLLPAPSLRLFAASPLRVLRSKGAVVRAGPWPPHQFQRLRPIPPGGGLVMDNSILMGFALFRRRRLRFRASGSFLRGPRVLLSVAFLALPPVSSSPTAARPTPQRGVPGRRSPSLSRPPRSAFPSLVPGPLLRSNGAAVRVSPYPPRQFIWLRLIPHGGGSVINKPILIKIQTVSPTFDLFPYHVSAP
jgi:hypothetical protein